MVIVVVVVMRVVMVVVRVVRVVVVMVHDALVRSPLTTQPRAVNCTVAEWRQCLGVRTTLCRLGPVVCVKSPGTHPPLSPLPPSADTCVSHLPVW